MALLLDSNLTDRHFTRRVFDPPNNKGGHYMFDEGISKVGWILIAVIVIVLFIVFSTPLGNTLTGMINDNIDAFGDKVTGILNGM